MQQVTIHSPGEIGTSRAPRMLTTAPATLRTRIKSKNFDRKEKSTCLSLGGKIKTTVFEITHVDSVDPEPGFGYGWSQNVRVNTKRTMKWEMPSNPHHAKTVVPGFSSAPEN